MSLATLAPAYADQTGQASVTDGDTIKIHGERIRLHGIDAPESGQTCDRGGKTYRCGQNATLALDAMISGQAVMRARPGEVSLLHLGVLFLDELPEFSRQVLVSLRQPLESGSVTVARANAHYTYPARVQLIGAMNPCRCGHLDDPEQACNRVPKCAIDYQKRISGPLFDRIDLHVDVPALSAADLSLPPPAEGTAEVRARVAAARTIQNDRYAADAEAGEHVRTNADADGTLLERVAAPDIDGRALLSEAVDRLKLSARGYHRVLRVARTLADLEAAEGVTRRHIAEALSYRRIAPARAL